MVAFIRTSTLLSVVFLWQCTLYIVEPRPLHSKKYTTSSSKHHHRATSHKNAVEHPHAPASLRQLALGSHKAARETLPFGLSPSDLQPRPAFKSATGADGFGGASRVDAAARPASSLKTGDGLFGQWGSFKPAPSASGFGGASRVDTAVAPVSGGAGGDDAFGAWGAFKPAAHTGMAGSGVATSGGGGAAPPKISDMWGDYVDSQEGGHPVSGAAPRASDDAFGSHGFGAFAFNEDQSENIEPSDGYFVSLVPYPEAGKTESESSFDAFDTWGLFREIRNGCDDNREGLPCMSNGDCHGCNRTFVCSAKRRCEKV